MTYQSQWRREHKVEDLETVQRQRDELLEAIKESRRVPRAITEVADRIIEELQAES